MKPWGTGNFENVQGENLLHDTLLELNKDMVYDLYNSSISRNTIIGQMDVMAFLSEHYQVHPGIRLETFEKLKKKVIEEWNSDAPEWTERFEIMQATMDKLEAVIRRYEKTSASPPQDESSPE